MSLQVRRATVADAPAIQLIVSTVYREYGFTWDPDGYHSDLTDFDSHYQEPEGAYWVVEEDGEVLGGGGVQFYPANPGELGQLVMGDEGMLVAGGADCELVRLYIRADQRGRGIGRIITDEIVQSAKSRGCRAMEIWSDKLLTLAHPFYRKMGAADLGDRVSNDPDQAEEFGFLLRID